MSPEFGSGPKSGEGYQVKMLFQSPKPLAFTKMAIDVAPRCNSRVAGNSN